MDAKGLTGELKRRAGAGLREQDSDASNAARASSSMIGWVAGGVMSIGFALFTRLDDVNSIGLIVVGVICLAMGLVMLIGYDRLPEWVFVISAPISALVVSMAIFFIHRPASPLVILYVPGLVSGFYFHGRHWAFWQAVVTGVGYGVVLAIEQPPGAIAWWIMTVAVLGIVGDLVGRVRDRQLRLVDQLEQAARTDPLTGLLNRRAFEAEFDLELERSRRSARPMSLMIGDLDHFKQVNDQEGHSAGDEALKFLAEVLNRNARRVDLAVRMGGEEFALLLPGTDEAGAYMLAERVRGAVAERFAGQPVRLTISFGIASYPAHGYEVGALLNAADHALYTAKALGRDRTVICNRAIASALATEAPQPGLVQDGGQAAA